MAGIKRKAPSTKIAPSKAAKTSSATSPSRRSGKNSKPKESAIPAATESNSAVHTLQEQPLFPRGGGSVLTPLEYKQIRIQAKKDVLFEEANGTTTPENDKKQSRKRKRKSAGKLAELDTHARDPDSVKIESLSFKRLAKGTLVLGQVVDIRPDGLTLALPNNITGHVALTAISESLLKRIEAEAERDNPDESEDDDGVNLDSIFHLGQYLRAYVVSTVEESSPDIARAKKRIELSIRPEHSNSGLNAEDVVQNVTIMASVHSVEDHGYEMDLGYDQAKLRGFLPKKEMNKSRSKDLELGATLLCIVNSKNSSGRVIQLSTKPEKLCNIKYFPTTAPTIDTFLPGTAVDVLVSEATGGGIVGKIVGHLDATADIIHSGSGVGNNLESKFKAGSKFKARVIYTFPTADKPKVGISVLPHIAALKTHHISPEEDSTEHGNPLEKLPISSIVEECTVRKVEAGVGLFVDLGHDLTGFVHISRVKDGKVDALYGSSGPYKVDSVHRGRVISYSAFDGIFQVTFQPSILEQKYLRLEDVPVGEVVNCVIEKLLLNKDGTALIVKLEEGIKGLVNNLHISDVALQNPEKKFKEGMRVKARVLEKDTAEKRLKLTLKKTLVNSDLEPITSYEKAVPGTKANGTIVKSLDHGAIVQFYGSVKGYLPQSEMSEAHIADHKSHFRIGQVLTVHVVDVDPENERLTVSCKDPSSFGFDKAMALKKLKIGTLVSGKVTEKTEDDVSLELSDSGLKAILPVGHLTDKSINKSQAALKRIRTGQTLSELVLLDKNEKQRFVTVTQKPSLVKASQASALISTFDDATVGKIVSGFVRNVTVTAAFVEFAGGFTALLPKTNLSEEAQKEPDFGLRKFQPLSVKITSAGPQTQRIIVAMPSATISTAKDATTDAANSAKVENAVDDGVTCMADLSVGKIIKAKVVSVKNTQVNVRIADNIQGRIDASQVFDSWDDIADPKKPLKIFKRNDICNVKVLGVHDARNHKFLPFSHRSVHQVVELSAKPSDLKKEGANTLSIENVEVGSTWVAFVNNISNGLWVNITPNIRGRIDPLNISDDVVQLNDLPSNFPVGTALRTRVLSVDPKNSRLDLTARSVDTRKEIDWDYIEQNMILPGRILSVKPNKYQVIVRLSDKVVGAVSRLDMVDDYDEADPKKYKQGELVRAAVVSIDKHNQKLRLSMRPSRVLNSALKVRDREITDASQLSSGDIVRGIVKSISDKGLFVTLGGSVVGMVKIKDLSDKFLKSWKDEFKLCQLVKGRVLSVDAERGHVQLSLRPSVLDSDYKSVITYNDLKEGQVITGKVRKVQEFGAFIVVDNSANVSGLAHRSEMADQSVPDAREIYSEGDVVKAIVLEIDAEKKRMSLGLKPSYFEGDDSNEEMEDVDDGSDTEDKGVMDTKDDNSNIDITGIDGPGLRQDESESEDDDEVEGEDDATDSSSEAGLETGGFDWNANMNDASGTDSEDNLSIPKKRRRKTKTVDLSTPAAVGDGPQRASDFDRLLLSHPDDSSLWIQYMAFQIQAGELAKAREIAERATQTINVREQTERMNVWIAYLNIEVEYGTEESLQEVFTRACQYNDEKDMHERLISIYIKAGKHEAADELFQRLLKKFGADSVDVWVNYAHFLFTSVSSPDRARELLPRATQRLGKEAMIPLTCKFAALEYRCESGLAERGHTLFEGVLTQFPKRMDIWNQLADLEIAAGSDVVRSVFERGTQVKGLKPLAAQKWFAKWQEWELKNGDGEKGKERVMAKAQEWVNQRKSGQNK